MDYLGSGEVYLGSCGVIWALVGLSGVWWGYLGSGEIIFALVSLSGLWWGYLGSGGVILVW